MTNGEKLQKIFLNLEYEILSRTVLTNIDNEAWFSLDWWNSEYKEPTTKNDLGVDCIRRDEVCRYVAEFVNHEFSTREEEELINNIITGIEHLPPITPQDDYKAQYESFSKKAEIVISQLRADRDRLMSLLSETPQEPKWISVSERLPEPFSFVNCTCHSLVDDREDWVIETCYIPQSHNSPYSDWGNIPMLNSCKCEVIAWMHRDIPKPYKAERSEE